MTADDKTGLPPRREAVRLKNARKHTPASQRWLARQLNDPYVQAARTQGWRSRAAFKLLELDDKYKLIGKNSLDEMCMATPAIARGSIVIRTASNLYRIAK